MRNNNAAHIATPDDIEMTPELAAFYLLPQVTTDLEVYDMTTRFEAALQQQIPGKQAAERAVKRRDTIAEFQASIAACHEDDATRAFFVAQRDICQDEKAPVGIVDLVLNRQLAFKSHDTLSNATTLDVTAGPLQENYIIVCGDNTPADPTEIHIVPKGRNRPVI